MANLGREIRIGYMAEKNPIHFRIIYIVLPRNTKSYRKIGSGGRNHYKNSVNFSITFAHKKARFLVNKDLYISTM